MAQEPEAYAVLTDAALELASHIRVRRAARAVQEGR